MGETRALVSAIAMSSAFLFRDRGINEARQQTKRGENNEDRHQDGGG